MFGECQPLADLGPDLLGRAVGELLGPLPFERVGPLLVEVEDGFRPGKLAQDLAAARELELAVGGDRKVRLDGCVVDAEQPAAHPAHGRLAAGLGEAVRLVGLEQVHALAVAEPAVEPASPRGRWSRRPWMSKKSRVPTQISVGFGARMVT